MIVAEASRPLLMRELLGESLRELRNEDHRTLREVSSAARVSLGYLSEIERGQKEPSSELLNAICGALGVPLSFVIAHWARSDRRRRPGRRLRWVGSGIGPSSGPGGSGGGASGSASRLWM